MVLSASQNVNAVKNTVITTLDVMVNDFFKFCISKLCFYVDVI